VVPPGKGGLASLPPVKMSVMVGDVQLLNAVDP
jgi:hypothetical protein